MAQMPQRGQVTAADELRDLLALAEKQVANIRYSGVTMAGLLKELDRIAELWPLLRAHDVDLRAEEGRWETLQALVARHAGAILGELGGSGRLQELRGKVHPEGSKALWWHLDAYVAETRRKRFRRSAMVLGGVLALAVVVFYGLRLLFPVDPKVQESVRRVGNGEQLVQQHGDWQGALQEFERAVQLTPGDYDVWLRLGVAYEKVNNTHAAQDAYARARALLPSELEFFKGRAAVYLIFNLVDPAEKDTQAALQIKNDDAQSWYQLASVYEARSQIREAIDALDKASQYAEETRQDELTALSRYRMGMMMQQMNASGPDGPPAGGTPAGVAPISGPEGGATPAQ